MAMGGPVSKPLQSKTKRLIDVVGASVFLLLLSPVIIAVAFVSLCVLGRPVLFVQRRPGLNGAPFYIIKFRTMRNVAVVFGGADPVDEHGNPVPDGTRMTRFGSFLRRTSIDELPELVNVIRGEMSLVGPRPLLMEYLPRYTPEQARRHEARPGITGLAQVSGRNDLSWEEKFDLDIWYIDNWSHSLDLQILLQTLRQLVRREGINTPGYATAPHFFGTSRADTHKVGSGEQP